MVDEVFRTLENHPDFLQCFQTDFAIPATRNNELCRLHADTGNAQYHLVIRSLQVDREKFRMPERPCRLRVKIQVEVRVLRIENFIVAEVVESHEPVRLVEPVFANQRRLGGQCGQALVRIDRHVARKVDALQALLLVEARRKREYLEVGLAGCPHDHLRALPRRQEARRVAPPRTAVFDLAFGEVVHGAIDGAVVLFGSEVRERTFRRHLDVHAGAVGIEPRLMEQRFGRAGNALQVDVAAKPMDGAEFLGHAHEAFHRGIGRSHHRRAQEQPFYIVAAVEFEREVDDFPRSEGRAGNVVAAAVHAVGTIVLAGVRKQDLEQRNATPVGRPGMADARRTCIAKASRGSGTPGSARRTGDVVLGGSGEDVEFFAYVHICFFV